MSTVKTMPGSAQKQKQAAQELSRKKAWEREHLRYPFWFGGSASCFAACTTHPLDLGTPNPAPKIPPYLTSFHSEGNSCI